jgi:hypothetical protein
LPKDIWPNDIWPKELIPCHFVGKQWASCMTRFFSNCVDEMSVGQLVFDEMTCFVVSGVGRRDRSRRRRCKPGANLIYVSLIFASESLPKWSTPWVWVSMTLTMPTYFV